MPRASAEAVAAARFRASPAGRHPEPPKGLSEDAASIWREVVECRPVDFFRPGALHLLETFCVTMAAFRENAALLAQDAQNDDVIARVSKLSGSLTTLATKLRISVQASTRPEDAISKESETQASTSSLLGGHAVANYETRKAH